MKKPMCVAITGAAGQIGYSLLFRIAAGDMLGKDQPIILQLLDIPQAQQTLRGVAMELEDCVFPMLQITVSYFTNRAGRSRRDSVVHALVYGLGIVLTFTALGFALAILFGAGLNLSSIRFTEFIMTLEEDLGIDIDIDDLDAKIQTAGQLYARLFPAAT